MISPRTRSLIAFAVFGFGVSFAICGAVGTTIIVFLMVHGDAKLLWGYGAYEAGLTLVSFTVAVFALRYRRRMRRLMAGQCQACGYDLRASTGRCPECGRPAELNSAEMRVEQRQMQKNDGVSYGKDDATTQKMEP